MPANVRVIEDSLAQSSPSRPLDVGLPVVGSPVASPPETRLERLERPRRTSLWVLLGATVVLALLKLLG